jgi:hypothetical protein
MEVSSDLFLGEKAKGLPLPAASVEEEELAVIFLVMGILEDVLLRSESCSFDGIGVYWWRCASKQGQQLPMIYLTCGK